jgi:hypothetical protein
MRVRYQTQAGTKSYVQIQVARSHLQLCSGQELELLEWLSKYTFPLEAKFQDKAFAEQAYSTIVRRIINAGVRPEHPSQNVKH